ncbi:MAG TPA: hypothetical protein PLP61_10960 [Nocardioides sp.]|uniref:hypothetical protein n=1 Tax=Nocardioides sp. TaxID=35761 RepID=UPI002CC5A11B|nr:hypothetical protein [Nocardioides sp.]HQR27548.1 hypothetical protein [Nocardioides sp.]
MQGLRCHVCHDPDLRTVRGVPASSPEQMFVELASLLPGLPAVPSDAWRAHFPGRG